MVCLYWLKMPPKLEALSYKLGPELVCPHHIRYKTRFCFLHIYYESHLCLLRICNKSHICLLQLDAAKMPNPPL